MGFEGEKIAYEHIYWDQATVLVQLGLLDPAVLPLAGAEQADRLLELTRSPS
jgi:carboxymethylenebutenolidase